jgi:hypothetical protein
VILSVGGRFDQPSNRNRAKGGEYLFRLKTAEIRGFYGLNLVGAERGRQFVSQLGALAVGESLQTNSLKSQGIDFKG